MRRLSPRFAARFEPRLKDARVEHFTGSLISFEARRAFLRNWETNCWPHIIARNRWFQQRAVQRLRASSLVANGERAVFHACSYAAREIFSAAKNAGHYTVLQQIDPGLAEEDIVAEICLRHPNMSGGWSRAPREYWQEWLEECHLADAIVVNSQWSRRGLVAKSIPAAKIVTVPLMYETANDAAQCHRSFPNSFDQRAPLKILFLGNLCVRKGIPELLEAAELLRGAPVRFCLVGPSELNVPEGVRANPQIEWCEAVPRAKVHDYYRQNHLFILPTHSDGFGLTQLEAQAWGLPVIASLNCGEVVRHGENGLLLPVVSGAAIAETIEIVLKNPAKLPAMSMRSKSTIAGHSVPRLFPNFISGLAQILQ
jgi:glycosyltransferase involved in cell wall biosynthesis